MLHNIKHFAQCNDTDYIDKVQDMLTMTGKKIVKMRCNAKKQTTIDEYFLSCSLNVTFYVLAFAHYFACT